MYVILLSLSIVKNLIVPLVESSSFGKSVKNISPRTPVIRNEDDLILNPSLSAWNWFP